MRCPELGRRRLHSLHSLHSLYLCALFASELTGGATAP